MSDSMFNAELQYQTAISIAKNLRSQGLLTEEEYAVIDTNLQAAFSPSLGTLLSENYFPLQGAELEVQNLGRNIELGRCLEEG